MPKKMKTFNSENMNDETLRLIGTALALSDSPFILYSDTCNIIYANDAARDYWPVMVENMENGATEKEATERQVRSIAPNLDEETIRKMAKQTIDDRRRPEPIALYAAKNRWCRVTHHPIGTDFIVGMGVDITELKIRESQLQEAQLKAEGADRAKSEFLANMSHEIRTPMNGVLGMAELLQKTSLDTKQQNFAETIYKSGSALMTIINDVLDFSKIEAGKMQLDRAPFNMKTAVEDVASLLVNASRDKGVELVVRYQPSLPKILEGDGGRIRQILTNLVGNAIKFTHDGYVLIDVTGSIEDNAVKLRIAVEDTGIGIPDEKKALVFDQFTQAEGSTTRQYGGTGLGLAITKSLVHAMDGEVGVQSTLGKGSTFHVSLTLPISDQSIKTADDTFQAAGQKILVVDDLAVNRQILEELLNNWGFVAHCAESGDEALRMLRESIAAGDAYPLALIDYHMPEMDGLELAKRFRDELPAEKMKVIVLSSVDDANSAQLFRDAGVQEALTKPVRSALLIETIAIALTRSTAASLRGAAPAFREPAPAQLNGPEPQNKTQNLLIAEDNEVNRMVIENMIDTSRFNIEFAVNGRQAYDAFRARNFDLVLMDISMPEMDGMEAATAIRTFESSRNRPRTPIAALTAHAMEGDRKRFIDAGMDDYLSKPLRKQELDDLIEKWVITHSERSPSVA